MLAVTCPECGHTDIQKKGKHPDTDRPRLLCKNPECGHKTTWPAFERLQREEVDTLTEHQLAKQARETKGELKAAFDRIEKLQQELGIVQRLGDQDLKPPKWLAEKPRRGGDVAIATAMLSDCHFDEVVNPEEINWTNAYDRSIAQLRLKQFFHNTLKLSFDYFGGIDVKGLVLPLGGDMVTGNIHEELARTNDGAGIMETAVLWAEEISAGIELLLTRFDRILIPCVTGNHGRNSQKPIHKGRNTDNFDWLIYKLVEKHFAGCEGVEFRIPDGIAARWQIYQTRYHMEHGDNGFRGGNGIAGIWSPIMRGDLKLRERERAVGTPYDVLLLGHFHQYKTGGNFVMNGSLKGMDEYASDGKFGFEVPRQAFWLTDPKHGMTISAPIHCVSPKETWHKQRPEVAWA